MSKSVRVLWWALCSLLALGVVPAAGATNVSGAISKNTTWALSGSPYVVTGTVTINSNKTLTVAAGVTVKFNTGTSLSAIGTLSAVGTAASPITFTSSAASPAPGNWGALVFNAGSSNSRLSYATVEYGGSVYGSQLVVNSGTPTFDHVTIRSSSGHGISSNGTSSTPALTLATVSNNTGSGIYLDNGGGANVSDTAITGNTSWAINAGPGCRIQGLTNVTASGNSAGDGVGYRGGTISAAETWRGSLPWVVTTSSTTVAAGVTLTVAAGTTVKLGANVELDVLGTLTAVGTAASPIVFTSAAASPTPGSWQCITFRNGSSGSRVSYATLRYGGRVDRCYTAGDNANNPAIIRVWSGTATLDHLTVSDSAGVGLYAEGASTTATVFSSTFSNNAKGGVYLGYGGGLDITDSSLTNNGSWAINAGAGMRLLGLTNMTVSGNAGGTKDAIGYRGGSVNGSDTWRPGMTWVHYSAKTTVAASGTLTVAAGTQVKFGAGTGIDVYGTLTSVGTAAAQIDMTSSATPATPGGWAGIWLYGGSSASRLSYTSVRYAGVTVVSAPSLDHLLVDSAAGTGLSVASSAANVTVSFSTFSNNTGSGVGLTGGASLVLTDSSLTGNLWAASTEPGSRLTGLTNLVVSGNGTAGSGDAVAYAAGTISGNEVWSSTVAWAPQGGVSVGSPTVSGALTIQAGTRVQFAASGMLVVYGTLTAVGTPAAPILFTSSSATPTPGAWPGIRFYAGSSASRISYATVEYAGVSGDSNSSAVGILAGAPTLDHLTVRSSPRHGVYVIGTSGVPPMSFLTLSDNVTDDLYFNTGSFSVSNSTFAGVAGYGLRNVTPTPPVDARLCYWGSSMGPSGGGPGTGTQITTGVLYEPWLMSSPNEANYFASVTVSNRTFDPADNTQFSVTFTSTQVGNWTVGIVDSGAATVRSFAGHGATATVSWDGKDGSGVTQPNGAYAFQLASTADSGPAAAAVTGVVIIDSSRQLTISNPAVTPAWFSPNGDGVQETTTFTATASYDDTAWTVTVKNSANAVVRTATGTGAAISFAWDGRDAGGVVQGDGTYTGTITATVGNVSASGSPVSVVLDRTFPVSVIHAPTAAATLSNVYQNGSAVVAVRGSASDTNFLNWRLQRGSGAAPTAWVTLSSGNSAFTNQQLAAWATDAQVNGTQTLRLEVWDRAGNLTTALATVSVANFSATHTGRQFDPGSGETHSYVSTVPFALTETFVIKNAAGQVVRILFDGARQSGVYTDTWDGRNDGGALVPDGAYFYVITLTAGGSSMVWDLTGAGTPIPSSYYDNIPIAPFDPFNNSPMTFTISIPPSRVHIGLATDEQGGVTCQPPEICLLEGYHEGGSLTIQWAGVDATGAFRPDMDWLGAITSLYDFSLNAVVAYGTKPKVSNVRVNPVVFGPASGTQTVTFDLTTYLSQTVAVTVAFLNQTSLSTLRTVTVPQQAPGQQVVVTWDGRADNGMLVAPGAYTVTVTATDSLGQQARGQILTQIQY